MFQGPHCYHNRWRQYLQRNDFTPVPGPWPLAEIDLEAWKEVCTPDQQQEVLSNLEKTKQIMLAIQDGPIGGHWSRKESASGYLRSLFPGNPLAASVASGIQFQLDSLPHQRKVPHSHANEFNRQLRILTVMNWRKRGICAPITKAKVDEQRAGSRHFHFILLFMVKKNGKTDYEDVNVDTVVKKWRGCLSATDLNEVLHCGKFKQHSEPEIDAATPPGCYQCRSDASDAYNQVKLSDLPISTVKFGLTSSRDLSCFNTGDPELVQHALEAGMIRHPDDYAGDQMQVLWFGASPSPFFWQKLYGLLLSVCRRKGCSFSTVMDDNKLQDTHPVPLSRSLLTMTKIHEQAGVVMSSKEPEAAIPKQVEVFDGSLFDSRQGAKFKSQDKIKGIARSLTKLLDAHRANKPSTALEMSSALGKLADAAKAMWGTKLFTDGLQHDLTTTLKGARNYHAKGTLSDHTCQQLQWWLDGGHSILNGRAMIHGHPVDQVLSTDWSPLGWGAVLEPTEACPVPVTLSVPFPREWQGVWSGWGETLVATWGVMAFAKQLNWHHMLVCLRLDNIAAICYLNKMGSKIADLNKLLWRFVKFCKERHLMVIATYIPGILIKADAPSRKRATLWDCSLRDEVLAVLCVRLCEGRTPTFDLFATHLNTKANLFASLYPDPHATWINCLHQSWQCNGQSHLFYAFPPPNQVVPLLAKIKAERKTVLLVLPAWPKLAMLEIAKLLIKLPVTFPMTKETLMDPHSSVSEGFVGVANDPLKNLNPSWFLTGYLVSGDPLSLAEGQQELLRLSYNSAPNLASQWLTGFGGSGTVAVGSCKWILQLLTMMRSAQR